MNNNYPSFYKYSLIINFMKVYFDKTKETTELEASTVKELLDKLKLNPETVLITKNNELLTENESLNKKDEIKILSVISGG